MRDHHEAGCPHHAISGRSHGATRGGQPEGTVHLHCSPCTQERAAISGAPQTDEKVEEEGLSGTQNDEDGEQPNSRHVEICWRGQRRTGPHLRVVVKSYEGGGAGLISSALRFLNVSNVFSFRHIVC